MGDIKDLKFDDKNFNQHTEFAMAMMAQSGFLQNHLGRS